MGRIIKKEYIRMKETLEKENLLIVIANIREITIDTLTSKNLKFTSRYSHSQEFNLFEVPQVVQEIKEIGPIELSDREFDELKDMYENDINGFLYYSPALN